MKKPNFFIVGAPKCGTTSLYHWLAEHPQVYMSPVKEPHYYNIDTNNGYMVADYFSLFSGATDQHIAIGEASVWYLFSNVAIKNIETDITNPRYIVMLRNPIEMAYSLHGQMLLTGDENVSDFEKAWNLQKERARGNNIPKHCRVPRFLQYYEVCCLGKQIERLLQQVPEKRLKIILLDDLKKDTKTVWLELLNFLDIEDDGRTHFPVKNKAKKVKIKHLITLSKLYAFCIEKLNLKPLGIGFWTFLQKLNMKEQSRAPLSPQMHKELKERFSDDISLLSSLLGKNLDHWLE